MATFFTATPLQDTRFDEATFPEILSATCDQLKRALLELSNPGSWQWQMCTTPVASWCRLAQVASNDVQPSTLNQLKSSRKRDSATHCHNARQIGSEPYEERQSAMLPIAPTGQNNEARWATGERLDVHA